MKNQALFLMQFLRNPNNVGSLIPSSRFLAREMVAGIGNSGNQVVVELGPGTGALTKEIYDRIHPSSKYLGFEINLRFRDILLTRFSGLRIIADGAEKMNGYLGADSGAVDYVISSIPFTTLPWERTWEILQATHEALKPGGMFRTFLYLNTFFMPKNQRLLNEAQRLFDLETTRLAVPNLPPAVVYSFRKK